MVAVGNKDILGTHHRKRIYGSGNVKCLFHKHGKMAMDLYPS